MMKLTSVPKWTCIETEIHDRPRSPREGSGSLLRVSPLTGEAWHDCWLSAETQKLWAWRAGSRALTGDEDQVKQGRRQNVQNPDLQTSKNQRANEQIFWGPRIWLTTRGFAWIGKERRGGTVFFCSCGSELMWTRWVDVRGRAGLIRRVTHAQPGATKSGKAEGGRKETRWIILINS